MDDTVAELSDAVRSMRLVVHRRPFPTAELAWDRDALDATVVVNTGAFHGSFQTTCWTHELANLRALLQAICERLGQVLVASFTLRDVALEADFYLERRGTLRVHLSLRPNPAESECLDFELHVVAPQVEAWIHSIDAVLTRFPPALETVYDPLRWITLPGVAGS